MILIHTSFLAICSSRISSLVKARIIIPRNGKEGDDKPQTTKDNDQRNGGPAVAEAMAGRLRNEPVFVPVGLRRGRRRNGTAYNPGAPGLRRAGAAHGEILRRFAPQDDSARLNSAVGSRLRPLRGSEPHWRYP